MTKTHEKRGVYKGRECDVYELIDCSFLSVFRKLQPRPDRNRVASKVLRRAGPRASLTGRASNSGEWWRATRDPRKDRHPKWRRWIE